MDSSRQPELRAMRIIRAKYCLSNYVTHYHGSRMMIARRLMHLLIMSYSGNATGAGEAAPSAATRRARLSRVSIRLAERGYDD